MAKIQNLFKDQNVEEAAEYLEANGFYRKEKNLTGTMFIKDDKAVLVYADKVSFREYDAQHDDIEFTEFASFQGINILSTIDWIYLFHITGIIPLKQFLKNVKKENVVPITKQNLIQLSENVFGKVKTTFILLLLALILLSFTFSKKPLMIQDYRLTSFERNEKGQIVDVQYEKVGEPYIMPDSALQKTVHVIINDR